MAQKTLKQLAEDRGVGEEAAEATDGIFLEKTSGLPKWSPVSTLPIGSLAGTIVTAQMGDNQVTDAKLSHSTANSLRGFDGAGAPTTIAAGTGILISGGTISSTGGGGGGSPDEGGGAISIADEGSEITVAAAQINFVGLGVVAADGGGNVVNVTIPGGGALATLDTLDGNLIDVGTVPADALEDQLGFTAGSFTNANLTVSQQGIVTFVENGSSATFNNAIFTGTVTVPDGALAIADTSGLQAALDSALQPADITAGTIIPGTDDLNFSNGEDGQVWTWQADGTVAFEAASAHTHVLLDVSDAGVLAGLDTVGTEEIDADAVTADKLADTGVTAGSYTNTNLTVDAQGRLTAASSGSSSGGLTTSIDANTAISVADALNGTHKLLTAATAITLTLQKESAVGTRCAFTPSGAGAVTVAVEAGAAGFWLPADDISGSPRTTSFALTGYGYFEVIRNTDNDSAEWAFVGRSNHSQVLDADLDANGKVVHGDLMKVMTDGGVLDNTNLGAYVITSSNITIPTTTGYKVILRAGGAHTVTFNATVSAAMATGDIMTIIVESATVIKAVLTAAADLVTFS